MPVTLTWRVGQPPSRYRLVNKFLLTWLVTLPAYGQGNAPLVQTNFVEAAPNFRKVNGKLYNTSRSVLWQDYKGDILNVDTNGMLLSTFTEKPVYQAASTSVPIIGPRKETLGYRQEVTKVQVDTKKVDGPKCFLRNYPNALPGQTITFRAMRAGTSSYSGSVIDVLDCGVPNVAAVVTTNRPSKPVQSGNKVATPK